MGFEEEEAQRRGYCSLCSRINRRLFGNNRAEVDEAGPGLVFVAGSSTVPGIIWRFRALGGREPSGFLTVKGKCNRKCCGRLAGGKLTGGCWNNPSLEWGSLVSWGCLGQIKDSSEWAQHSTCEPEFRKRRSWGAEPSCSSAGGASSYEAD